MKCAGALILIGLFSLLSGCADLLDAKKIAIDEVREFRRLYAQEDFAQIYQRSHPNMQAIQSEAEFVDFLQIVRSKLGGVRSADQNGWNAQSTNGVTHIVIQFNTTFTEGSGSETFTFVVEDGRAYLFGYNINSMDLVK